MRNFKHLEMTRRRWIADIRKMIRRTPRSRVQ